MNAEERRNIPMIKLALAYTRYALTARTTIGFGSGEN